MTKKDFKEMVGDHTYTGWDGHRIRINALFFDWKQGDVNGKYFGGYKFMVAGNVKDISKKELFDLLYKLVNNIMVELPRYVKYRHVTTDEQRFKPGLSFNM